MIDGPLAIVSGSRGFLGTRVVFRLKKLGWRIVEVDLAGNPSIDIRHSIKLHPKWRRVTPIVTVHLAAMHVVPTCIQDPARTVDINVLGTQNMLHLASELNCRRFIFASSAAVYAPSVEPVSEASPLAGVGDVYGFSKLVSEALVAAWGAEEARSHLNLRLFNLVGEGDPNPHLIPQLLERMKQGSLIEAGSLDKVRDYVFVDDVAQALVQLADSSETGDLNLGSGVGLSVSQVVDLLSDYTRQGQVRVQSTPGLTRSMDNPHLVADESRSASLLGWTPRSLIDVVPEVVGERVLT